MDCCPSFASRHARWNELRSRRGREVQLAGRKSLPASHELNELTPNAQVRFALLNVNTLLMSTNFFLILIPIYSYSLFLPTIIEGMGYSDIVAQLFTVPPNFLAFLVVIGASFLSDRIKMRGPLILAGFCIAAIGYIMQLASDAAGVKYAGTFFIAAGAFPCSPLILAWLSNNLAPHYTKATGLGFQVAIGNCGAFVAT